MTQAENMKVIFDSPPFMDLINHPGMNCSHISSVSIDDISISLDFHLLYG